MEWFNSLKTLCKECHHESGRYGHLLERMTGHPTLCPTPEKCHHEFKKSSSCFSVFYAGLNDQNHDTYDVYYCNETSVVKIMRRKTWAQFHALGRKLSDKSLHIKKKNNQATVEERADQIDSDLNTLAKNDLLFTGMMDEVVTDEERRLGRSQSPKETYLDMLRSGPQPSIKVKTMNPAFGVKGFE